MDVMHGTWQPRVLTDDPSSVLVGRSSSLPTQSDLAVIWKPTMIRSSGAFSVIPSNSRRSRWVALVSAVVFALAAHAGDAPTVGQVSLVIGEAKVVHKDGSFTTLRQGASIAVGDRIETTANGHVHVRFVDNAMVSVRPESILEVQSYRFDATNPQANEVRLKMAQGVGRSISGAATEADKSRFRLNTPIAAIGVRGTDFIVQASANDVRATVASGAIVMAPLGNGCTAEGLGACSGRAAQLLSADMGRMMVELRNGERVPRVVPAVDSLLAVSAPAIDSRQAVRAAALAAAQPSATDSASLKNDRAAAQLLAIAPLGPFDARELTTLPDKNAQLAWGRWFSRPEGYEKIVLDYDAAAAGRHITTGDGGAGLFRAGDKDLADQAFSNLSNTRVDFRLTRAQASYEKDGRSEAASVDGGTLSLDFLNKRFATALALSNASAGKAELRIGGEVRNDGIFTVRDGGQYISGAISQDTKEAGYTFTRDAAGGLFRGRTLWGR
jgi:hypothetical protein